MEKTKGNYEKSIGAIFKNIAPEGTPLLHDPMSNAHTNEIFKFKKNTTIHMSCSYPIKQTQIASNNALQLA